SEGEILLSPSEQDLVELRDRIQASGAESIAISLLFSFANTTNERAVADWLRAADVGAYGSDTLVRQDHAAHSSPASPDVHVTGRGLSDKSVRTTRAQAGTPGLPISVSHEILPEFRE